MDITLRFTQELSALLSALHRFVLTAALATLGLVGISSASAQFDGPIPWGWEREFPLNGFQKASVPIDEIISGGPPRDGIPAIDAPVFETVAQQMGTLAPNEPVISLIKNGEAKAYPLRILMWHEIANDTIGGLPVAVTYCPLCNSAIVFERRVGGQETTLGVSGKLRNSDMIMYDRLTENWWQQFTGEAIVGPRTGEKLKIVPSRLESFARFAKRAPNGKVLVPNNPNARRYVANPYVNYDSSARPFLYRGSMPEGIAPMERVVRVKGTAWSMPLLQRLGRIAEGDLILTWEPGQASAVDSSRISEGREVGKVIVQRQTSSGPVDVAYEVTFAFVFHAFEPEGRLITG